MGHRVKPYWVRTRSGRRCLQLPRHRARNLGIRGRNYQIQRPAVADQRVDVGHGPYALMERNAAGDPSCVNPQ